MRDRYYMRAVRVAGSKRLMEVRMQGVAVQVELDEADMQTGSESHLFILTNPAAMEKVQEAINDKVGEIAAELRSSAAYRLVREGKSQHRQETGNG